MSPPPSRRLFIGNLRKDKTKSELERELRGLVEGIAEVVMYMSAEDRSRNRGFAFIDFHDQADAAKAREILQLKKPWGDSKICADWAEPEIHVDPAIMDQVKVLFVRNLASETTEERLLELFGGSEHVERVKKLKDFAFIHFADRTKALEKMAELNHSLLVCFTKSPGIEIQDGATITVVLSKPSDEVRKQLQLRSPPPSKKRRDDQQRIITPGILQPMTFPFIQPLFPQIVSPLIPNPLFYAAGPTNSTQLYASYPKVVEEMCEQRLGTRPEYLTYAVHGTFPVQYYTSVLINQQVLVTGPPSVSADLAVQLAAADALTLLSQISSFPQI